MQIRSRLSMIWGSSKLQVLKPETTKKTNASSSAQSKKSVKNYHSRTISSYSGCGIITTDDTKTFLCDRCQRSKTWREPVNSSHGHLVTPKNHLKSCDELTVVYFGVVTSWLCDDSTVWRVGRAFWRCKSFSQLACDEMTVWRLDCVTSWLCEKTRLWRVDQWRIDRVTTWPCDEMTVWWVDW